MMFHFYLRLVWLVAMGNASDELKAVADYVTLDVDHNGVAAGD